MPPKPLSVIDVTTAFNLPRKPVDLLVSCGLAKTKKQAKRYLKAGSVRLYLTRESDPLTITDNHPLVIEDGTIINFGRHWWRRIRLNRVLFEVYDRNPAGGS